MYKWLAWLVKTRIRTGSKCGNTVGDELRTPPSLGGARGPVNMRFRELNKSSDLYGGS